MRNVRIVLSGTVMVALLTLVGAPVAAQDEMSEVTAPVAVSGTLEFMEPTPEAQLGEDGETAHGADVDHVHRWTSDDPRMNGTATYTGSWHLYDPPSEDCDDPEAQAGAVYEITADTGGWRCAGVRAPIPGPDGATNVHTLAFRGTGENDGLSAYVLIDWSESPYTFSALITPNDVPIVPVLQG